MPGAAGRPEPEDPYRVLGLGENASPAEVTRAFRRLARSQHPDVQGGAPEADQQYRRIRGAYEVLSDPARRAAYDSGGRPRPGARGRRIPVRVRSRAPRRGADIAARVQVSLAEAVYGTDCRLPARGRPGAAGAGETGAAADPGSSGGSQDGGEPPALIRVPAGTVTGTRLRISGLGAPGQHGGSPGDLLVTIDVADHPSIRRHGRDLYTIVTVGYPELLLGAEVPVQALDGRAVTVRVPPGTSPGDRLRVTGLGVPATGHSPAGDLVVETRLQIPTELAPRAREALAALAAELPPPRAGAPRRTGEQGPRGGNPEPGPRCGEEDAGDPAE